MMGITSTPSGNYCNYFIICCCYKINSNGLTAMRGPSTVFGVGAAVANNKRDDINQAVSNMTFYQYVNDDMLTKFIFYSIDFQCLCLEYKPRCRHAL